MLKISQLIKNEIIRLPVFQESEGRKIINITAAAKLLKRNLEKQTKRKLNITTISMAIRRCLRELPPPAPTFKAPRNLNISTRSNLFEISVVRTTESLKIISKLRNEINIKENDFFSVFQGVYEIVVFTDAHFQNKLKKTFKQVKIVSALDKLALITVGWGIETKDVPGIYFQITRELAINSVAIQSMHTIGAEMMIVVKENDLMKAHKVIIEWLKIES